jgi:organic radical activating enzyme
VAGGNPADAAFQLKSLIKALHAAGIEVLLEVSTHNRPDVSWLCVGVLLPETRLRHAAGLEALIAVLCVTVCRMTLLYHKKWRH